MKLKSFLLETGLLTVLMSCTLIAIANSAQAQTLPYELINNSEYPDDQVYVAIVGITDGHVWVDPVTGQVNPMRKSDNTVQGPIYGGNQGPGGNGLYANCFRPLTQVPNNTIHLPKIAGCRIMISFESQLYLYFFGHSGAPSGYAAPNLANPTDPNLGIKFELIELTFNDLGLWCNTTRVDSYQYPMGLEVWGDSFYKKVGEVKTHADILASWQATAPPEFQPLLDTSTGMIHFPTKTSTFPTDFFQSYIDAIWSKYATQQLVFNSGEAGVWRGSVQGSRFVFTRDRDNQVAVIPGKPTTLEAMEGSGVLASGDRWDLVVQAQFVAAITRHAIDLDVPSGVLQDFGNTSKYYQTWPYNWYAKFLHQESISFEGLTYAFAYDDVFDQSATVHTPNPQNVRITIGGFVGLGPPIPGSFSQKIEAENFVVQSGGLQLEACSEGGQNVGYIENGDWMVWDLNLPVSGRYQVEYRVASPNNGGIIQLEKAGGSPVYGTIGVPNTSGWQNWTTISHNVNLDAGQQQIAIYVPVSGWNINWLRISHTGSSSAKLAENSTEALEQMPAGRPLKAYPNPFTNQVNLTLTLDKAGPVSISIIDATGQEVHSISNDKWMDAGVHHIQWDAADMPAGLYFYRLSNGEKVQNFKLLKR